MKSATLAVAAISLLQLATAQPHRRRHAHLNKHEKKDVVATVVDTVYAEATEAQEVIIFVDQYGNPVSTLAEGMLETPTSVYTQPSSPPALAAALDEEVATTAASSSTPVAYTVALPSSSSSTVATSSAVPTQTSSAASSDSGYGISYSPYKADGSCKDQDEVNTDFASFGKDYSIVRTYGTDCNQVATVLSAAKSYDMKVFAGIFYLSSLSDEIAIVASAAAGDWSNFHTIAIGNELVNSGSADAATVVAAIGTARGLLTAAGYTGKVVTVDTLVVMRANPSLCDNSDYCACNSHPFYDGNTLPADSGSFLTTQISTLQAVLANKNQEIIVTETGWPWQGETNGLAIPSPANQAKAISSIKGAFSSNPAGVILFTPYNDYWKTNTAAQFQAEQYWGFIGNAPSG